MTIQFEIDTEKKSYKMNPSNKETVEWFINQFPAFMGAYYGSFMNMAKKHNVVELDNTMFQTKLLDFIKCANGEVTLTKEDGGIPYADFEEIKEEDPDCRK